MSEVICQYCGHSVGLSGPVCSHCGAPVPEVGSAPRPATAEPSPGNPVGRSAAGELSGVAGRIRSRLVSDVESGVRAHHPAWQWRAASAVLVVVLLLLVILMVRSCSFPFPTGGLGDSGMTVRPAQALPDALQGAACRPRDSASGVEQCVVAAGDPVLEGGLTGGRELTLYVQVIAPAQLDQLIAQWRSIGATVVADDEVFAAVSGASAVLFADTGSGLRLDTGTFVNRAAAQTFLARSGLL
ncbi:hypothetical protein [Nocardia sp. NBC_01329]|uniref:hypothetical protein n=1 Tax=Nocardia sp. NBC_01329 TaxID=2903594 RepID=UPI002E155B1A|nr:hypothetical protein OG405_20010 [Nocardia sp. NBC_01329]